ncbi:glutathione-dependent formaldehyde-activating enzyme [Mycena vulgaris]|nr:glutathione-dependent formaldehyde-activating enzyme [Mycena vulgaris]
MSPTDSEQLITYRGNCHCGAFKFTFTAPELKQAFACNCSICSKNGYIWALPATNGDFVVVGGDEDTTLKSYEFGKRTMAHKFCPTCGTSVLVRMHTPANGHFLGINVRALMDVEFDSLQVRVSDGAAQEPPYQAPRPLAQAEPATDGATIYTGSCHCGAVAYTLRNPEPIARVVDCNCSICSRDATLWIHPAISGVVFEGLDSLTEYTFGQQTTYHGFCKACGVAIRERFVAAHRADRMALNVRTMNGVDLAAMEVKKNNGRAGVPTYEESVKVC